MNGFFSGSADTSVLHAISAPMMIDFVFMVFCNLLFAFGASLVKLKTS